MFTIYGQCLGLAKDERGPKSNRWNVDVLGIQITQRDLFGSPDTIMVEVPEEITESIREEAEALKGKKVQIEVELNARSYRDNATITYRFVDFIKPQAAVKAADKAA